MRYAVISDVHGNKEALQAVLAEIDPTDTLLCLGDIIGYGPSPNECITLLRDRGVVAVLGNHDVAAVDDFGLAYFNEHAREAIRWTKTILLAEHREWLDQLSYELREPGYLMVHGAPVRYFEYCKDLEAAQRAFSNTDAPLILVGHTHIAEYYARSNDGTIEHRHMQRGGSLILEQDKRYIVNVGSVGQPRDLNPQACFVLYDVEQRSMCWKRIDYAIDAVVQQIAEAALPSALGLRLKQGR